MEQLVPWLIFCIAVAALCLVRPHAARIFIGVFFIIMAVAVNALLSIVAPDQFVLLGTDAPLLLFYAWFFEQVVAPAPQIVGILAAMGEIVVGVLILSNGRRVKVGLIGAIIFLIVITPLVSEGRFAPPWGWKICGRAEAGDSLVLGRGAGADLRSVFWSTPVALWCR